MKNLLRQPGDLRTYCGRPLVLRPRLATGLSFREVEWQEHRFFNLLQVYVFLKYLPITLKSQSVYHPRDITGLFFPLDEDTFHPIVVLRQRVLTQLGGKVEQYLMSLILAQVE